MGYLMQSPLTFSARTTTGAGRGKTLGTPTINLDLRDIPSDLTKGVYACALDHRPAVLHYDERPSFADSLSCEVHVLDAVVSKLPEKVTITLHDRLRDVQKFATAEALMEQIREDIRRTRAILASLPQKP